MEFTDLWVSEKFSSKCYMHFETVLEWKWNGNGTAAILEWSYITLHLHIHTYVGVW